MFFRSKLFHSIENSHGESNQGPPWSTLQKKQLEFNNLATIAMGQSKGDPKSWSFVELIHLFHSQYLWARKMFLGLVPINTIVIYSDL